MSLVTSDTNGQAKKNAKIRRPPSVWVTQILLGLGAVVTIPPVLYSVVSSFGQLLGSSYSPLLVYWVCAEFAAKGGLIGLLIISNVAIAKRTKYARYLGLVALFLLFALNVIARFQNVPVEQSLPKFKMNSPAEESGARIADYVMVILYLSLFIRFGFSSASRRFLSPPDASSLTQPN